MIEVIFDRLHDEKGSLRDVKFLHYKTGKVICASEFYYDFYVSGKKNPDIVIKNPNILSMPELIRKGVTLLRSDKEWAEIGWLPIVK